MLKVILIIFIICFLIGVFIALFTDPEKKAEKEKKKAGDRYEKLVAGKFEDVFKHRPIRNVLLDTENGDTEVDMIVVDRKGIFSIECKHINDMVFGSLTDSAWKKAGVDKEPLRNPIMQNKGHIKSIEEYLGVKDVINVVVTSAEFVFSYFGNEIHTHNGDNIAYIPGEHAALIKQEDYGKNNIKLLKKVLKDAPDVYTEEEVKEFISKLSAKVGTKEQLKEHAERIKNTYQ